MVEFSAESDKLLASLAMVNVKWESNRSSYLDNFIPFVLDAIKSSGSDADAAFSDTQVADLVQNRFGLSFPAKVIGSILRRAARSGLVVRASNTFAINAERTAKMPDLGLARADCQRRLAALISRLQEFAKVRFDLDVGVTELEDALLEHVRVHAVPLLGSLLRGDRYTMVEQRENGLAYMVSAFIVETVDRDPRGFADLDAIVKGSMLASALYVTPTETDTRRFKQTTLLLDTPLILKALGHEGRDAQNAMSQMLVLATAQGAEVACFEHSVREAKGVLQNAVGMLRHQSAGGQGAQGVYSNFLEARLTSSDAQLLVERVDADLARIRVKVLDRPAPHAQLTVDEGTLEDLLQKRVRYLRRPTLLNDLDSLTAIHRLRGGTSRDRLEECRAVLVTDNANLVRAAREFGEFTRHGWPIAMLDHDLATLLWVKRPAAAPDLPQRQVISDCYAALAPGMQLWSKYIEEIDRLRARGGVTEEDIALLRYSNEARRLLMDATFGDPSELSSETVENILLKARRTLLAPVTAKLDAAVERVDLAEKAKAELDAEAEARQREQDKLNRRVEKYASERVRMVARIKKRAHLEVAVLEVVLLSIATLLVGAGVVSLFPEARVYFSRRTWKMIRFSGAVIAILGVVTLLNGANLKGLIIAGCRSLEDKRARMMLNRAGLSEDAG